ncbi:MmcB family DNA repair protein [Oceanobacillus timonensis]|uniref:MmcB family DNA repair protein n=1 Tax=Oceanobacillus timonensis TaxID=1926285 RepID=UPI0009BB7FAA|nr:MmcB family DNA repair protein [Oceanobacillus timonensis]
MKITGKDTTSKKILEAMDTGINLKEIPSHFPVSLDQAKRLSRYYNIIMLSKSYLPENITAKVQMLGLKALYLAPLFKNKDWDGLVEILSVVDHQTKRKDLPVLMQSLEEKRNRISEFQSEIETKLKELEHREHELLLSKQDIQSKQEQINKEIRFLNKYPKDTQQFLLHHLGIYEKKLVLARRLDSRWQRALKKKEILTYSKEDYIWYINDLDAFAYDYQKRITRKTPYPTEWDYEKEVKRHQNANFVIPTSPVYRLPEGIAQDLRASVDAIQKNINQIESERVSIKQEMKRIRKLNPQSFMESVEAINTLSSRDLKIHGALQDKALKWLYQKDYIVSSEVVLPNGKRADVIGYNQDGHIIIVEVKASVEDFQKDDKWMTYLDYCHELYFLLKEEIDSIFYSNESMEGIGLLREMRNGLIIKEPFIRNQSVNESETIQHTINKSLSKKFVFGY